MRFALFSSLLHHRKSAKEKDLDLIPVPSSNIFKLRTFYFGVRKAKASVSLTPFSDQSRTSTVFSTHTHAKHTQCCHTNILNDYCSSKELCSSVTFFICNSISMFANSFIWHLNPHLHSTTITLAMNLLLGSDPFWKSSLYLDENIEIKKLILSHDPDGRCLDSELLLRATQYIMLCSEVPLNTPMVCQTSGPLKFITLAKCFTFLGNYFRDPA